LSGPSFHRIHLGIDPFIYLIGEEKNIERDEGVTIEGSTCKLIMQLKTKAEMKENNVKEREIEKGLRCRRFEE